MTIQPDIQKVTAHIPRQLLQEAQEATGKSITKTLELGLERITQDKAYRQLSQLQGAYQFSISLDDLREDRKLS